MADYAAAKAAIRKIISDAATDAGSRVKTMLPENPTLPTVTFQFRGGPGAWGVWNEGETARVQTFAWAESETDADRLHSQVRAALLPASDRVNGYRGTVNVTIGGQARTVNISGIFMNGGPNGYIDPPTELPVVECYYLVNYW